MKNYTSKKNFIKLTKTLFNTLFAFQTEFGYLDNLSEYKVLMQNIAYSLGLELTFTSAVLDKYYFARIRELYEKNSKANNKEEYVSIQDFEVMNERVGEARIQYLEDKKEFRESRPGYDLI